MKMETVWKEYVEPSTSSKNSVVQLQKGFMSCFYSTIYLGSMYMRSS